jgi:cyclopropane-fatty-acyl-phospholipid synthase
MSLLDHQSDRGSIDLRRWPDLAPPTLAPVRSAIARLILRQVAARAGIRVDLPDGHAYGPASGPVMRVGNPRAFFARLGADSKIGFGESYMTREWESDELIDVLVALACDPRSLIPRPLQFFRRGMNRDVPDMKRTTVRGRPQYLTSLRPFQRTICDVSGRDDDVLQRALP